MARTIAFLLVMVSVGHAQNAEVQKPPCPGDTTLPRPDDCEPSERDGKWLRVGRIGLEVVMGTALGAVPEVIGAYAGLSIDVASGNEAGLGLDVGLGIGAILGVGSSVYLAGYLMNGDGAYGWTILGSTVGTGLGAGLLAINSTNTTLVFAALLPVAGAVTGYELSSHYRRRSRERVVMPSITSNSIGIAGTW